MPKFRLKRLQFISINNSHNSVGIRLTDKQQQRKSDSAPEKKEPDKWMKKKKKEMIGNDEIAVVKFG